MTGRSVCERDPRSSVRPRGRSSRASDVEQDQVRAAQRQREASCPPGAVDVVTLCASRRESASVGLAVIDDEQRVLARHAASAFASSASIFSISGSAHRLGAKSSPLAASEIAIVVVACALSTMIGYVWSPAGLDATRRPQPSTRKTKVHQDHVRLCSNVIVTASRPSAASTTL